MTMRRASAMRASAAVSAFGPLRTRICPGDRCADAPVRRRLRRRRGILGRGAHLLQSAACLFHQGVARLGRQGFEAIQGELGGGIEAVGLALRHIHQGTELVGGGLDQIAHGLDRGLGGAIQIACGRARRGEVFDQLGALAFDLGGEVLLIGAQGVGGCDQGGALLAEAFLDGLDLLGDARTGVLKSDGLAR